MNLKRIVALTIALAISTSTLGVSVFAQDDITQSIPLVVTEAVENTSETPESVVAIEEPAIVETAPDDSVTVDAITDESEDITEVVLEETFADEAPTPLTFTAQEAGSTVTFSYASGSNVKYNKNNAGWLDFPTETSITLENIGDTVSFKGKGVTTNNTHYFTMTGKLAGSGDVTSLTNETGGDATLTGNCYYGMFYDCKSLTTAPALPATTLVAYCYAGMFYGCTGLTEAPTLPATKLATECYSYMFQSCTSLTTAPALPATELADYCYFTMFQECAALTTAPELPATTLTVGCYAAMFAACTGLTTAPALPATTLADSCYYNMFLKCSSLKISNTQTGAYTKEWRIPTTGTATAAKDWNVDMLSETGGDFTTNPTINTTYYLYADPNYLTFTAQEANSTVTFNYTHSTDVMYKTNGGVWTAYTPKTPITLEKIGDTVQFKGTNVWTAEEKHFTMTGKIAATGDVTSLTNGSGGDATLTTLCYQYMFQDCTSLTTAPALPSITLKDSCYSHMFDGCTSLATAPALPATTLSDSCYQYMFQGCTSLTAAPMLNASELADRCYYGMFQDCTALTTAPALPAITMKNNCYVMMFQGCIGLTTAPALPATTLADTCYYAMFQSCTSLTTPPALPATTLVNGCYNSMFYDCTGIKISKTKTDDYAIEWRIPTTESGTGVFGWNSFMLKGTGGTFKDDPELNTTYYIGQDKTPPVISGIENGKTYCIIAEFTVTDADLATVTANGTALTAVGDKYKLTTAGTYTVVATDTSANSTTVTVTLNATHTYDNACDTTCNVCGATRTAPHDWKTTWSSDGTNHWHECALCGEKKDTAAHTWNAGVVTKEPTETEKGVKTYTCTVCGATKTEEIAKLAPIIIEGNNGSYQQGANGGLTFKSNAAFADFISVSVDGNVIDKANYTLKEGSTIVTLTDSYLATLSVGKHTLAINSTTGTASTEFIITAKATNPTNPTNPANPSNNTTPSVSTIPQTADTTPIGLLMSLMTASIIGVGGIYAIRRKNRK